MFPNDIRINPNKTVNIVERELSYKIVGVLFEVHRELGGQYQEKYYQRAVAKALEVANIPFEEQIAVDLSFKSEKIGKYYRVGDSCKLSW